MAKGTTATAPALSKIEAVRQCLQAKITKPKEGSAWIKEHLGADVDPNMFSAYKAQIAGKNGTKRGRKPATPEHATNGQSNGVRPASSNGVGMISVQDATTLKGLLGQYGPETICGMVEVLSGARQAG